jgi:hypothetical protein
VTLRTLSPAVPLTRGQPFELFLHSSSCAATLHKIVAAVGRAGERLEGPKPRTLPAGSAAVVQLQVRRDRT